MPAVSSAELNQLAAALAAARRRRRSWNAAKVDIDEALLKATADRMISLGLKDAGCGSWVLARGRLAAAPRLPS